MRSRDHAKEPGTTRTQEDRISADTASQGMTREQSAILQGTAALLMIYHHFFSDLSPYGDILQFPFPTAVIRFAWFCKICVGIFAFVSGYGMCRVLAKKRPGESDSFFRTLGNSYLTCLAQLSRLFIRYWLILLFFVPLLCLLGKGTFSFSEFLANFFCLKYTYNGALWYMGQYVKMLLLLPLLDGIFLKCAGSPKAKWLFYGLLTICGTLLAAVLAGSFGKQCILRFAEWMRPAFILVFFMGYLFSKFRVYERIFSRLSGLTEIFRAGLGAVLLLASAALRIAAADSAAYARLDFLIVPAFVPGLLLLTEAVRPLQRLLKSIGSISAYLWMIHIFIYGMTASLILSLTRSHLLFYFIEVLLCILTAAAIRKLSRRIR